MAKPKKVFTCSFCGYQSPKWLGKCSDCGQWNTFYEEILTKTSRLSTDRADISQNRPLSADQITSDEDDRLSTGIGELERVLGGGLVRGAVILVGGDPGIGKSTLVLQVLMHCARCNHKVLYVSGEESLKQIKMRAQRLGDISPELFILAETSFDHILNEIEGFQPDVLVIDSVQTIYTADLESAPGSVSQIRETTARLIHYAKSTDTATLVIGHVTKEGAIAGPRVLEHMVDTVLYFEGDRGHSYRILRSVKNRFGATDEIGVFEMGPAGLREVESPSELFIAERSESAPGSVVVSSLEGTRPILVEIQALVTPTTLSLPRRTAIGFDHNRASLLVAVVEKKLGISLYNQDIFFNIAGGIRITEPGVDLGFVASVVSSTRDLPVPAHTAICGEVGLTGEVRAVSQIVPRIKEAQRLGFSRCVVPKKNVQSELLCNNIDVIGVATIRTAIETIFSN